MSILILGFKLGALQYGQMSVDVIIPTYNCRRYVLDAIGSVLAQTHRDVRVVVVDDGSTDGTEAVVRGLKDPRVVYLKKTNAGPSAARNFALPHCTAPFIAYLDADDVWYPEKLERQLALFEANPKLGLVYGYHHILDAEGRHTGENARGARGWIFDTLLEGNVITGSASMVVVPRVVLDKVGPWREDLRMGEDWELWMRIAQKYEIDFVPDFLVDIRVVPSGAQQNYRKVAEGHMRSLSVILGEFRLSGRQRRLLLGSNLWIVAIHYFLAGDMTAARRTMLRTFAVKPALLLQFRSWDLYARIFIDKRVLRWLFGTKARPSGLRRGLQALKRVAKGRAI